MLRVIFDTNIYGLLFNEKDFAELRNKLVFNKDFIVYGYTPIRKEIRDIPKVTYRSKKTRNLLLSLYDKITGDHFIEHSSRITEMANKYYTLYRSLGGIYNWNSNIKIDFMIVACASFHSLDVVCSADIKTLLGEKALKAYMSVNNEEKLKTPNFLKYRELVERLRKSRSYNL